ncbi:unnamed protein product [Cyprideis torosa]|uniref:Uncharacterized protein n=1 Tax=Cyprideis torosa TaxID=163714 RepID=A0A7R8WFS9_9CRUS|nr:unnamed protein product [Cyprideis torosa]CAG0892178.1 unnamed protein product [Cyprideis torosa]
MLSFAVVSLCLCLAADAYYNPIVEEKTVGKSYSDVKVNLENDKFSYKFIEEADGPHGKGSSSYRYVSAVTKPEEYSPYPAQPYANEAPAYGYEHGPQGYSGTPVHGYGPYGYPGVEAPGPIDYLTGPLGYGPVAGIPSGPNGYPYDPNYLA